MTYLADVFMWCWCWLAYRLVILLPVARRRSLIDRATFWLLPFAGFYGYHDPDCGTTWRWSRRVRERASIDPGTPF